LPNVTYNYTLNNVPDGNPTSIYVRGNDTAGNYGIAAVTNVVVDSLFTNLGVSIYAPDEINQYGVYDLLGTAFNYNEETIPFGDIELNLSFNDTACYLEYGEANPELLLEIEPGTGESADWWFHCSSAGAVNATVTLIYTPDNRTKSASDIMIVLPVLKGTMIDGSKLSLM